MQQPNHDGPSILPDEKVPETLAELFSNRALIDGMRQFLPPPLVAQFLEVTPNIRTVADFQAKMALPLFDFIEKTSISALTVSGIENLDPAQPCLFISNHRDIVLDSAFLNTSLFRRGFRTSQIAIGDNLMKNRVSELIFLLNKSFVVKRTGSPMELYRYSMRLSEHILQQITTGIDSVWIAQREGRAKNGDDRTQTGLLKMLSLAAGKADLRPFFASLRIVPVSISYEFNPCDALHAQEFLNKRADANHKKSFNEDLQHMLLGLKGKKGEVHFHFDKPLDEAELAFLDEQPNPKKQLEALAERIDRSIHANYRLHEINQTAFDLLQNGSAEGHSPAILSYFEEKHRQLIGDDDGLGWRFLLGIYANPWMAAAATRREGDLPVA